MSVVTEKDIEDLIHKFVNTNSRLDVLKQNKAKVEAVLDSRRQDLKKVMDQAIKSNFDPNKIHEELQRLYEVLSVKVSVLTTEVEDGENMIRPMLKEIQGI